MASREQILGKTKLGRPAIGKGVQINSSFRPEDVRSPDAPKPFAWHSATGSPASAIYRASAQKRRRTRHWMPRWRTAMPMPTPKRA